VQTRAVHSAYAGEYAAAPTNRKDLFEGTVNVHWKAGLKVAQDEPWAAHAGDTTIRLEAVTGLAVGRPVWIGAANSLGFYQATGVDNPDYFENGHMRAQVFTVVARHSHQHRRHVYTTASDSRPLWSDRGRREWA